MLGNKLLRRFRRVPRSWRYEACDITPPVPGGCDSMSLPESGWGLCTTCPGVYATEAEAQAEAGPEGVVYYTDSPRDGYTRFYAADPGNFWYDYHHDVGQCSASSISQVNCSVDARIRIVDTLTGDVYFSYPHQAPAYGTAQGRNILTRGGDVLSTRSGDNIIWR